MEILRVENLCKTYGDGEGRVEALRDVSLSIEKGEFVAVVGASGSGKSTLLHLMGGVDVPTSGKVFVDGTDIYAMSADARAIFRRRQIGMVYQFYNLIPTLTVEENVTLPKELDGESPNEAELENLLKRLGLLTRRHHLPNELSGGQQQRAGIGRALINAPAIFLADEPTGNLDSVSGEEVIALIKEANRELGQTTLIITHDLELARTADRVLTIEDGRIAA